ncbi:virion structural protein [Staphylococcus phage S-CoN_Ph35]|nr:virion structural protein [Staphylococcus phage S-CoN_Ph35]
MIIQGTDDDWLFNSNAGVEVGNKNLQDTKTYIGAFYKVVKKRLKKITQKLKSL